MTIIEETRLTNRPSYYYEDIVRLNKIDSDRITVRKIDFSLPMRIQTTISLDNCFIH